MANSFVVIVVRNNGSGKAAVCCWHGIENDQVCSSCMHLVIPNVYI